MTDTMKEKVKTLVMDKNTGRVTGFSLHNTKAFFDFSQYRETPWDDPVVGAVVEIGVTPREPTPQGTPRYWVKSILRCDTDTEPPPFMEEDGAGHQAVKEHKAEVVKAVEGAEDERERNLDRRKAMECAAEVVAAYVGHNVQWLTDERIGAVIDLCLDKFLAATK